ncbi:alpha-amylase [Streptomyces sp. NPDC093586]|uniref:alpha-amylase n=1 Tax=Streptomyces sp. NPDC093586 TaxID=3366042 RepID=UPI00382325C2
MRRFVRSTVMATAVVLAVAVPGTSAHAESKEGTDSSLAVPACVTYSAGWRYTFVINDCSAAHTVKVVYGDGTDVPCQEVSPGAWFTFPGYGTAGNTVEGVVLCDSAGSA